jgi:Cof subfamily protein (haloacid dehalogenase superfamily)
MNYRLLVTDLDGTLLDAQGRVHPRDREAIRALRRRGVMVSIATGRMYSGTRHVAEEIGVEGPIGCLDGALVIDTRDHRALESHDLDAAGGEALLGALAEHQPITYVFADDLVFHDERGAPFLPYVRTWSDKVAALPDVVKDRRWTGPDARLSAVVALGSEAQVRGVAERVAADAGVFTATFSLKRAEFAGTWGLVARRAGVSKATALSSIAAHHGVSLEETVVVGDWLNDVPMFGVAGRSFVMAQAPEEVKRHASDVLESDSARGGGIEEAARRTGLL